MSDYFDQELKKLLGGSKPVATQAPPQSQDTRVFLLFAVLLLAAAMMIAYQRNQPAVPYLEPPKQQQQQRPVEPTPEKFNHNYTQVDQRLDRLESGFKAIWDRAKWNSDRLTLLATIHNHNMVVVKNSLPKSELILLNSDWTINRMPDRINLDAQDQEFLKRYLRK